ncbi:DUF3833 family protein [Sphingomonas astaxanthinifaciens]|uniref:DUF3833 domain-containing protein n=1 Tax=Sphingomonas astaxanthinifaciens DSM 22298 TaxID=1123267 RepID=A0ABQ5Z6B8_9SPHN|nr:DUF3833 family protein [Sphingomonas astaxanthinifaciens]GLR48295.1 hypothetical protein GCM10007925_20090 [Sphingomonas astaxanthinifaciens DSM 22298]
MTADVVPAKAGTSGSASPRKVPAFAGTTALSFLLLAACASPDLPAGPAPLDPIAFFEGTTSGTGLLDPIVGKSSRVTVDSQGVRTARGLRLVQRIKEGSKPERTRVWTIEDRKDGFYTGNLTDAKGMVVMDVVGARANIAYSTPSGLSIHQQLALQADGRTILNRLEAYKFGIRVATLDETIRKPLAK